MPEIGRRPCPPRGCPCLRARYGQLTRAHGRGLPARIPCEPDDELAVLADGEQVVASDEVAPDELEDPLRGRVAAGRRAGVARGARLPVDEPAASAGEDDAVRAAEHDVLLALAERAGPLDP